MKTFKYLLVFTVSFTLFNCSTEDISIDEDINTLDINSANRVSLTDACITVDLIAGQHIVAGTVSVFANKTEIIIKYETINGWEINATHLSIGNDGLNSFPTTGSGNPKIGHFEYATDHSQSVTEYEYTIDKSDLADMYYFAAHAVVVNENSKTETAWAKGKQFEGNNWAMYVTSKLSYCDINGDGSNLLPVVIK